MCKFNYEKREGGGGGEGGTEIIRTIFIFALRVYCIYETNQNADKDILLYVYKVLYLCKSLNYGTSLHLCHNLNFVVIDFLIDFVCIIT